ncbi:hypothetical protein JCM5350_003722 [Sporobolomyces pararoseus]
MSETIKLDHFSSLPPELLSDIFEYAYEKFKPPTLPISRSLLPSQRQSLYRQIKISSTSQFDSLMTACEMNSGLGRIVRSLEIENADAEGGGTRKKNAPRIRAFLSTLVNLQQLRLGGNTSSIIAPVLSYRIARSSLPRLRILALDLTSECSNLFDSTSGHHLSEYPSLCRLELSIARPWLLTGSERGGAPLGITELALKGLEVYTEQTLPFLESLPNLSSLTLESLSLKSPSDWTLLLVLPDSLTSLTLRKPPPSFWFVNLDQYLPRLVNIEYLYLADWSFSQNPIDYFCQLSKLKTPGLGEVVILSCEKLKEITLGPRRPPLLERVIFDQVEAKVGWRIWKDSNGFELHPEHDPKDYYLGPGWVSPNWSKPHGFGEMEVLELVREMKQGGIEVEGKTVEAFRATALWRMEIGSCQGANCFNKMWPSGPPESIVEFWKSVIEELAKTVSADYSGVLPNL